MRHPCHRRAASRTLYCQVLLFMRICANQPPRVWHPQSTWRTISAYSRGLAKLLETATTSVWMLPLPTWLMHYHLHPSMRDSVTTSPYLWHARSTSPPINSRGHSRPLAIELRIARTTSRTCNLLPCLGSGTQTFKPIYATGPPRAQHRPSARGTASNDSPSRTEPRKPLVTLIAPLTHSGFRSHGSLLGAVWVQEQIYVTAPLLCTNPNSTSQLCLDRHRAREMKFPRAAMNPAWLLHPRPTP